MRIGVETNVVSECISCNIQYNMVHWYEHSSQNVAYDKITKEYLGPPQKMYAFGHLYSM